MVKELVENSIDAGANRVRVEIEEVDSTGSQLSMMAMVFPKTNYHWR